MSNSEKNPAAAAQPAIADATPLASRTIADSGKCMATAAPDSVKDAGRVHVGAGMMRF
jgi:hypothetical protein